MKQRDILSRIMNIKSPGLENPRADKMISPEPWECLGSRVDQPEHTYKQLYRIFTRIDLEHKEALQYNISKLRPKG